jgi:hypothetical protein
MAGDKDRPALGCETLEQAANPSDALGIESVDGLIEDQDTGIPDEGAGDPEPLSHAERVLPGSLTRHRGESDGVEHLIDPPEWDVVGLGQIPEVVGSAATRVKRLRIEQGTHLSQRPPELGVCTTVDER